MISFCFTNSKFVADFSAIENCVKAVATWRRNYSNKAGEYFVKRDGVTVWQELDSIGCTREE